MATIYPNGFASANTIRQQHQRLNSLLEAIQNRFNNEQKPSRNLVSLLNALAVHLQTHFELEESDGYLSALATRSPALTAEIDRLLSEHGELLSGVNDLVDRAREDFTFNHDTSDLAHRFAQFQAALSAHEHAENILIQEAYTQDLGTKD